MSYNASQADTDESIPAEIISNVSASTTSYIFNSLPGDTSYSIIVVAVYPDGQRIPSPPLLGFLPGYSELYHFIYYV